MTLGKPSCTMFTSDVGRFLLSDFTGEHKGRIVCPPGGPGNFFLDLLSPIAFGHLSIPPMVDHQVIDERLPGVEIERTLRTRKINAEVGVRTGSNLVKCWGLLHRRGVLSPPLMRHPAARKVTSPTLTLSA